MVFNPLLKSVLDLLHRHRTSTFKTDMALGIVRPVSNAWLHFCPVPPAARSHALKAGFRNRESSNRNLLSPHVGMKVCIVPTVAINGFTLQGCFEFESSLDGDTTRCNVAHGMEQLDSM